MKKLLLIFIASTFLCSCSKDPKEKIVGEWKEYWGVGQETDVTYSNTYEIQITAEGEIILKCKIPNEKFYIYYKMKLSSDGKWMEGPISNSRNQTDYVKWEKIK